MTGTLAGRPHSHLTLAAGRDLTFGPPWPCSDARLAFDRNSGDFWALSPMAVALLDLLRNEPDGLPTATIDARLRIQSPECDPDTLLALSESLINAKLLQH